MQNSPDIAMTEVETIGDSDSVADDVGRETVTLVGIHRPMLPKAALLLVSTVSSKDASSHHAKHRPT